MMLATIVCNAETLSSSVVKFGNGITYVDIIGDGTPAMVVAARRENFNAHGFDVVSIYVQVAPLSDGPEWNLIPITVDGDEKLTLTIGGGADCVLHDFRLLRDTSKRASVLVIANRELGDSFASSEPVTFTYFELKKNTEGDPGSPSYYFEKSKVTKRRQAIAM